MGPRAILGIAILGVAGCATFESRKQIISIDASPRGSEVFRDGAASPIGTTPFFYEIARQSHLNLAFAAPGGPVDVPINCSYRWPIEVLGNGILALLHPAVALGGLIVDYASGAAFDCPARVRPTLPRAARAPERYCPHYIVAPPAHPDRRIAREIAERWMAIAQRQLSGCATFTPYIDSQRIFESLGWYHLKQEDFSAAFSDSKKARLGLETKASHVVVLRTQDTKAAFNVLPAAVDLHTGTTEAGPTRELTLPSRGLRAERSRVWTLRLIDLLPNSLTAGTQDTGSRIAPRSEWAFRENKNEGNPLGFVSNMGAGTVLHPDHYEEWQFIFRLYPSIDASYERRRLSIIRRADESEPTKRRARLTYVVPTYNGSIAWHNPIGTLSFAFGIGPAFRHYELSGERSKSLLSSAVRSEVAYMLFLTQRIFLQISASTLTFGGATMVSRETRIESTESWGGIRVGYYFGDPQSVL